MSVLKKTPLHDLHVNLGAKMVAFAGYSMPVQYPLGVMKEHLWTRSNAGIFDVSHMGQAWIKGETQDHVAKELEKVLPADIRGLKQGRQQYTQLLNNRGTIIDDLIVTRPKEKKYTDRFYVVVNASRKEEDFSYLKSILSNCTIERLEDRAQIALQGPKAESVLSHLLPDVGAMTFMTFACMKYEGEEIFVSRSGYTGEDGYEISLPMSVAQSFCLLLLESTSVQCIGLGARDSLRLEAGLCLYGNDLDVNTTPVEADLRWSIGKRRRDQGDFAGSHTILQQLQEGVERKRVGFDIDSRLPCRQGTEVFVEGKNIGKITSGVFGATVDKPVAMGYIKAQYAGLGTPVILRVRGRDIMAKVCSLPFVEHRYRR